MIGHNVDVASSGTPEAKRLFFFDKGLHRRTLICSKRNGDFIKVNLHSDGAGRYMPSLGFRRSKARYQGIISRKWRSDLRRTIYSVSTVRSYLPAAARTSSLLVLRTTSILTPSLKCA